MDQNVVFCLPLWRGIKGEDALIILIHFDWESNPDTSGVADFKEPIQ